jgi:hypothetical protein
MGLSDHVAGPVGNAAFFGLTVAGTFPLPPGKAVAAGS